MTPTDMTLTDTWMLAQDLNGIADDLGPVSRATQQALKQVWLGEVNATYHALEQRVRRQCAACDAMAHTGHTHGAQEFRRVFEREKGDLALDTLYRGVAGGSLFGKPLLEVHFHLCGGSRVAMETRCSHLLSVLRAGLEALTAYATVTEDDEEQIKCKWVPRVEEIQAKMEAILRRCS